MTRGEAIAVGGLVAGGGVLAVVAGLLQNVVRPAGEIDRYAKHIAAAGQDIARNVEVAPQLGRTRDLALAVPDLAHAYLRRLGAA